MSDAILHRFLHNSLVQAMDLAAESDVLRIVPCPPLPPADYVCEFLVPYLRRLPSGLVEAAPGPVRATIHFPKQYLRSLDPRLSFKVVSIVTPDFTHPNVASPTVCLGTAFVPGTPIGALLRELFEIVTYRNYTLDESNALNPEACRLLRQHPGLLAQLDRPPLRRSRGRARVTVNQR